MLYWRARALRILMLFTACLMGALLPVVIVAHVTGPAHRPNDLIMSVVIGAIALLVYWLAGRGAGGLTVAGMSCVPIFTVALILGAVHGDGLSDPAMTGLISGVVLAALVLGPRGVVMMIVMSVLGLIVVDVMGPKPSGSSAGLIQSFMFSIVNCVIFVGIVLILWERLHRSLREEAVRAARAEQETATRAAAVAESAETQERFLQLVSHDLRGPLSVLKLGLQVARMQADKAGLEQTLRLGEMQRPIQRMERLIKDLQDVVRLEANKLNITRKPCDLKEMCVAGVDEAELAGDRKIAMDLPDAPVMIDADADRLGQVLENLLSNALKYSPKDAKIGLTLRVGDGEARMAVQNDGSCISSDRLPHIFERFYRGSRPGQKGAAGAGLGLGLYICRELVRLHGGRIWAESTPERGTTLHVVLPLRA